MSDEHIIKVKDNYQEHELHSETPDENCSECWKIFYNHACCTEDECKVCKKFASVNLTDNK